MSAATADIDNDQTNDEIIERLTTTSNPSINHDSKLFVHYTHEKRLQPLKRDIHQVYNGTFEKTPAMYAKLIVDTRNRRDAKHELIRKRPK